MKFVRSVYSWAQFPNPDAVPVGRFVIDLGWNNGCDLDEVVEQVSEQVDYLELTENAPEQLEIPEDEWDLYYKETEEGPRTLLIDNNIYPDYIWDKLKEIDMKTIYISEEDTLNLISFS